MIHARAVAAGGQPALLRLAQLAALSPEDRTEIIRSIDTAQLTRAQRDITVEGREMRGPRLIASGWAARVRTLIDGRRQFLSFLLPGDLVGMCNHPRPLAITTVVALTDTTHCGVPRDTIGVGLTEAYARSSALHEAYLLAQIVRLGRMTAQERIVDLFLELFERLTLAGLTRDTTFELPLTQETLGDALGLTAVHVNRMLQAMRRAGDIDITGRRVSLRDPVKLARSVGRLPVRISATDPEQVRGTT